MEKALSLGANFANAYSLKGDLEIEEDNFRAALEGYSKALTLLPEPSADRQKIKGMVDMLTAYLTYTATKDRNGPAVTKPVALTLPRPNYTEDARSNHIQGVVRARVLIDETGLVKYFIPITRLGYGLDEEAQYAVFRMRFSPATVDHQPIPYWIVLEVTFNLR